MAIKKSLDDVVEKIKGNEDRLVTNLKYYVGGEHYDSGELQVKSRGKISGEPLGFKFHFPFKSGDVLFMARNPHLRKAGRVDFEGICSDASYILRTKDETILRQNFLPLIVQSDCFWNFFSTNKTGSVNPLLNWGTLKKYVFNLPNIETQDYYSKLIWLLQESLNTLRGQMALLDSLVKSQFNEMFGDCNSKSKLEDVCSLHARIGWQGLTKNEHRETGNHLLITGTDFKEGLVNYPGCKFVSKYRYDQDSKIMIQNGDILVTKDGSIGKVALVKDLPYPATLNAGVFVIRINSKVVLSEYLQYCLMSNEFSNFIESVKRGATIPHLNQEKFIKYQIPLPSIILQKEFISFVNQVDKSKFFCRNHIVMTKHIKRQLIILHCGK